MSYALFILVGISFVIIMLSKFVTPEQAYKAGVWTRRLFNRKE